MREVASLSVGETGRGVKRDVGSYVRGINAAIRLVEYILRNKMVARPHNNQSRVRGGASVERLDVIQSRSLPFGFEFSFLFQCYKSNWPGWLPRSRQGIDLRPRE